MTLSDHMLSTTGFSQSPTIRRQYIVYPRSLALPKLLSIADTSPLVYLKFLPGSEASSRIKQTNGRLLLRWHFNDIYSVHALLAQRYLPWFRYNRLQMHSRRNFVARTPDIRVVVRGKYTTRM